VEHELRVRAVPDEAWSLSAMPGWFAFGVPAEVAGTDRLCCLITVDPTVACAMVDVRQEIDGQMICWQARGTQPVGSQTFSPNVPVAWPLRQAASCCYPQGMAGPEACCASCCYLGWAWGRGRRMEN
jgi:hypothetical protein